VTTSIYPVPSICSQDQISDWFASLADCLHWNERKKQKAMDDTSRSSSGNFWLQVNSFNLGNRQVSSNTPGAMQGFQRTGAYFRSDLNAFLLRTIILRGLKEWPRTLDHFRADALRPLQNFSKCKCTRCTHTALAPGPMIVIQNGHKTATNQCCQVHALKLDSLYFRWYLRFAGTKRRIFVRGGLKQRNWIIPERYVDL